MPGAAISFVLSSAWTSIPGRWLVHRASIAKEGGFTFLEKDTFEQRVLVSEHQALVRGRAVALLETLKRLILMLDRGLELLDILRPPFSKGCLGLTIPLLSLLRGSIDLLRH